MDDTDLDASREMISPTPMQWAGDVNDYQSGTDEPEDEKLATERGL